MANAGRASITGTINPNNIGHWKRYPQEGREFATSLLSLPDPPDGLFCANDHTAISAIQVAKQTNLNIPGDLSVIGFSNSPASTIIEPSLTTIDDHAFEMGQSAARLLIRQIENKDKNVVSETVVIRNDLILRNSTKKIEAIH